MIRNTMLVFPEAIVAHDSCHGHLKPGYLAMQIHTLSPGLCSWPGINRIGNYLDGGVNYRRSRITVWGCSVESLLTMTPLFGLIFLLCENNFR